MSTTTPTPLSPQLSTDRPEKIKQQGRVVVLKLSPTSLSRFESPSATPRKTSSASAASAAITSFSNGNIAIQKQESQDMPSESNSTPAPPADPSAPTEVVKKRKGPAPGYKRSLGQVTDGTPKPRGKPGPKKKPRLEDGTIDHSAKPNTSNPTPAGPKLGPKANQGTINANLRALDRSGKPCRKWERKPFSVKSFTGVSWDLPSWRAPVKAPPAGGDDSAGSKDVSMQSSSDLKPDNSSVAMESNAGDQGDQGDPMIVSTPVPSSPAAPPQLVTAQS